MNPRQIRAALVLKGIRQVEIAKGLGVTEVAVSRVISGQLRSARIERAVAKAIEQPVHKVFPVERVA
jgi:predicted transcriptional regulator